MYSATAERSLREGGRHEEILAAAERVFIRLGFHAATMQHIATEAGMSPGNLYRYFTSKDAIIAELIESEQADLASDFTRLADSDDLIGGLNAMLRNQLIFEPREHLQLILEIWAESAHNAAIALIFETFETKMRGQLRAIIEAAKQKGATHPNLDINFAVRALLTIGYGLFKRRVHEADFEGEAEVALALALINPVFSGLAYPASAQS